MRISFRLHGHVYDKSTEQPVENPAVLSALDGWHCEVGSVYDFLDMKLVDQGITGGIIRAAWTLDRGLEIITDYWAPDTLQDWYINQLRDETFAQLSDGIGEGGFEILLNEEEFVLVADTHATPDVELVDDGTPILMPSRVARAARDGDMALLEEAIASGEAIDSTIQGYSGLHLAIIYGRVDAALVLISNGANTSLLTKDDMTPLHLCALSNSLSDRDSATVARELLGHGADRTITTPTGDTAASFAEARKKTLMLTVLKESAIGGNAK